ncbi:serine/threonine-protein kinase [Bifidobacterium pullorum]|uniref:non-specific serine/threonine protein kinase n=1 Tax=Bifidobacterium pullorum subsp. gallinarum TaxID=78344 RepID=A0A921IYD1_9BIFI|nr:serine/threonine-protein kinase [Bifidobacterium pullorum]HJG41696.1 serine/threonine protein kinase [Bifidobacterium pullorum subsp. gallinarum]
MSELNLESGQLVGGYTLISRLGAGAMGSVWRVRDDGGQEYAMKILRDSLSEDDVPPDSPEARERLTARERLRREAMALRRVQHPGVCGIVDMELDDSLAFIVTELIEGKNLRDDVAANGRYVGTDLERLTRKLIDAVKAVHAAGIIHRDIKPTNVMVSATGPILVDFGIAMGEGESHVTRTGLVMGTPGFIAPEIIDGAESDEMTDWWSVASVLAFAATGAPVFGSKPMMAVLERAAAGNANLTGLPAGTTAAFRSALDPDRSKRCAPEALLQAIERDAMDPTAWEVVRPFDPASPDAGEDSPADPNNPRSLWTDDEIDDGPGEQDDELIDNGPDQQRTRIVTSTLAPSAPLEPPAPPTATAILQAMPSTTTMAAPSAPLSPPAPPTATAVLRTAASTPLPPPSPLSEPSGPPTPPHPSPLGGAYLTYTQRESRRKQGLTPCLLATLPVAILAASHPFGALTLAFALFWAMLAAGLNAESQFRREIRHDGKRRYGDGLRRAAAVPWHLVKGSALAALRIAPMTAVVLGAALAMSWLLGAPSEAFVATFTPTSHPLTTLLPVDVPLSASGLFMAGVTGLCWLANVLAFSPDTLRIGAATLCGMTPRRDAGDPADETADSRPHVRRTAAIAVGGMLTALTVLMAVFLPSISWFPLFT